MRFKGLDLNLLVVLDAVLTERNVTRAAERINLSQSATSSALTRLRHYFNDEILVKSGRDLRLTPRAQELQHHVRKLLADVDRHVLTESEFDPKTANKNIRIMTSDFVVIAALRHGLEVIGRIAPNLTFEILPVNSAPYEALERFDIDLLISPENFASDLHPEVAYFDDDYVCVCDANNPIADKTLSPDEYLGLPHVTVRFPGTGAKAYDDKFLDRMGYHKNVSIVAPSHATLPLYLVNTNRVATLQRKLADEMKTWLPIRTFPVPIQIPRIREILQWHSLNDGEPTLKWIGMSLCEIQEGTFNEAEWQSYPPARQVVDRAAMRISPRD